VLGLRLVEQTVNDDDRSARHFIFGDADGTPGTLITCLEYPDLDEGKVGRGSTHHFALAVESPEELAAWKDYLAARGIATTDVLDRTGTKSIYLRDPDGHIVEIAA
jgi:catechol 2,3-dioxygenase-like lactoylglutathione lyase family enzyme